MTTEHIDPKVVEIGTEEEKEKFVASASMIGVDRFLEAYVSEYSKGESGYDTFVEIGTIEEKRMTQELSNYFYAAPEA